MGIGMQIAGDIGITHMLQLINSIMSNPKDNTQVRHNRPAFSTASMRGGFDTFECVFYSRGVFYVIVLSVTIGFFLYTSPSTLLKQVYL